jgi:hydroxymethylglutaryl-CoA lyase
MWNRLVTPTLPGITQMQHHGGAIARRFMLSTTALPRNHDIKIVEVGPRDGLQNEKQHVSTQDKIQLVRLLAVAGCSYIEVGAFVSKKWVPSMADAFEVMQGLNLWKQSIKAEPPVLSCLTPNLQGLDRAIQVGATEIAIFGSASEVCQM